MNHCHARSIPLGTPAVICDGSRQSRIVAAKRIPGRRKSHPPSAPTRPAPAVGCGAIHSGRGGQAPRRKALQDVARVAKPDTLLAWYRQLVAQKFGGSRCRAYPGRPRVSPEVQALVIRLARENRGWRYDRIVGALANLGFQVSDQTVGNILRRHNIAPAPERSRTTTWKEFIRSHLDVLAGADFFTVEVLTWRGLVTYYVLFFIEVTNRRVSLGGITRHPDSCWMEQVARNATMQDTGYLNCRSRKIPKPGEPTTYKLILNLL